VDFSATDTLGGSNSSLNIFHLSPNLSPPRREAFKLADIISSIEMLKK
jgi:hypothetical protein